MVSRRVSDKAKHQRPLRPGILPTVGLVVEGDAEFEALPRLHKKKLVAGCPPLKATNLGGVGSDVTPSAIAKRSVGSVMLHQIAGRSKVVLVIDREQRADCSGAFATAVREALHKELQAKGKPTTDVHVVVADRAFEGWILADAKGLHERRKLKQAPSFNRFEGSMGLRGTKGKDDLTRMLDREYSETSDGPTLFESIDFTVARQFKGTACGSRSLDKFLRTLGV